MLQLNDGQPFHASNDSDSSIIAKLELGFSKLGLATCELCLLDDNETSNGITSWYPNVLVDYGSVEFTARKRRAGVMSESGDPRENAPEDDDEVEVCKSFGLYRNEFYVQQPKEEASKRPEFSKATALTACYNLANNYKASVNAPGIQSYENEPFTRYKSLDAPFTSYHDEEFWKSNGHSSNFQYDRIGKPIQAKSLTYSEPSNAVKRRLDQILLSMGNPTPETDTQGSTLGKMEATPQNIKSIVNPIPRWSYGKPPAVKTPASLEDPSRRFKARKAPDMSVPWKPVKKRQLEIKRAEVARKPQDRKNVGFGSKTPRFDEMSAKKKFAEPEKTRSLKRDTEQDFKVNLSSLLAYLKVNTCDMCARN